MLLDTPIDVELSVLAPGVRHGFVQNSKYTDLNIIFKKKRFLKLNRYHNPDLGTRTPKHETSICIQIVTKIFIKQCFLSVTISLVWNLPYTSFEMKISITCINRNPNLPCSSYQCILTYYNICSRNWNHLNSKLTLTYNHSPYCYWLHKIIRNSF